MSKENKSRYAILGLLGLAPMSGYDIRKAVSISIGNFWRESYGQIYPMLKQLDAEGLVTKRVEQQPGRPDRHVYALTERGQEELRRWLGEPVGDQIGRNELLLKLFFSHQVPAAVSLAHVQRCRALQLEYLRRYEQLDTEIPQRAAGLPDLTYMLITLSYGKHIARALLDWCDETIAALSQLQPGVAALSASGAEQDREHSSCPPDR